MIEVVHNSTGDRAEALCPESALVAARALRDDAHALLHRQGFSASTVSFYVDGRLVRELRAKELG